MKEKYAEDIANSIDESDVICYTPSDFATKIEVLPYNVDEALCYINAAFPNSYWGGITKFCQFY